MPRTAAIALLALFALAGCGDADSEPAAAEPAPAGDALDLRAACPKQIVVQGSWWPGITEGDLYSLLGPDPDVDRGKKRVTAPLVAQGKDTGVTLELRSGGPAIGYARTPAQMYVDRSITLGRPSSFDEVIQLSAKQPTLAVLAPLESDPQMIFWDPETHPELNTIRDIGRTDTTVLYPQGSTFVEYLIGARFLKRSQLDGGYDPARVIAERGEIASSGYATHDPYLYREVYEEWGKPIKYQLVSDTGYPNYPAPLVIRPDDKEELAPCLRKLVPIIQQSQVDLMADPDDTVALIARLSDEYKQSPPATKESEQFAVAQMKKLGIVGDGEDATLGNFVEARVQRMIDITKPIFAGQKKPIKDGLSPSDVVTNEFVDPKLGLEG